MSLVTSALKSCASAVARPFGRSADDPAPPAVVLDAPELDGRDECLAEVIHAAAAENMDVNDWLERDGGAVDGHRLERTTIRLLLPSSWVLELGPGSGRHSRHLVRYLTNGQLHLVDPSPWRAHFLRQYFAADARVRVHEGDSGRLPAQVEADSMDMVCAYDLFHSLRLGQVYQCAHAWFRVLKPGGFCTCDYLDITGETGWNWLEAHADPEHAGAFSYFTPTTLLRVFMAAGFEPLPDCTPFADYSYLVFHKPTTV